MDGDYEDQWSVEEWLEKAGLAEYAAAFIDNGYDTPELCASLKVEDLDAIGVTNKYHRGIVFTQARQLHAMADAEYNRPADLNHLSPNLAPTSEYSEPWAGGNQLGGEVGKQNGVLLQVTESKEVKKSKKGSKEKAEKSSKSKQHRNQRSPAPAISPTLPPYQRDGGTSKLTKLQLKLKLREELQKDRVILSEAPYCREDGTANEGLLIDLGERYAAQFGVDSLDVYDAIKEVFKHTANTSEFVTSTAGKGKKVSREETDAGSKSQRLGEDPDTNYDEPFDTQKGMGQNLASRKANKSKTMPASGHNHYDEPFDTVTVDVKGKEGKITAMGKQEEKVSRLKPEGHSPVSSPEERRHSADETAGRKSPKISPKASPKTSPKGSRGFRLFRKKQKPRSHSVKDCDRIKIDEELDTKGLDATARRKHGSAENIQELGRVQKAAKSPKRTSVPFFAFSNGNPPPLPPNHPSRGSADSATSDSDGSPNPPKKTNPKLLKGFHSPPTYHRAISNRGEVIRSGSFSGGHKIERRMTKTSSDMEINRLERETDGRQTLRMSQSHDELRNIVITAQDPPQETEKQKKDKGNFIRRLFKWKSSTPNSKKRMLKGDNRVSAVSETSSLTSSMSMPEINRLNVEPADTAYAEVFEAANPNHEQRGKSSKPPRHLQKSPLVSPNHSPLVHRRLELKSGSDSSTTDHLVIPIQSGSAPERTSSYLRSGVAHGGDHSPELEVIRFSDSEDQRSERTTSCSSSGSRQLPPTNLTTPRADDSCSAHSRQSSQASQTEDAAAYTHDSRCSSNASSVSTERSGPVSGKPLPPPKPAKSLKRKSNPPQSLAKTPTAEPSVEVPTDTPTAEPSVELPTETSRPKPPPKPARSKHRSIKVHGQIIRNTESDVIHHKSHSVKERTPSSGDPRSPPAVFEKSHSEKSLRLSERLGSTASTTSTDSSASDGSRKPKPLPKPRAIPKPAPPPKAAKAIETLVSEKLAKEGIDLTQTPYSTVWGEGAIPYPLVTRYAAELRQSEARVAQAMDTVRGKELKKFSREYVPMAKEQWQSHLSPCTDSIEALLTSVGLPMYVETFKNNSIQQVLNISEAELEALQMNSKHSQILMGYIHSIQ